MNDAFWTDSIGVEHCDVEAALFAWYEAMEVLP